MVILLTVLYRTVSSDSTLVDNRNLVCLAMLSLADKSWLRGCIPGGDAYKHHRFFLIDTHANWTHVF